VKPAAKYILIESADCEVILKMWRKGNHQLVYAGKINCDFCKYFFTQTPSDEYIQAIEDSTSLAFTLCTLPIFNKSFS
jgi:hypothetical protein